MFNDAPIGTVCAFAGQVVPVSGQENDVWSTSSCGSTQPEPGSLNPEAPLSYLEADGWMLCDGRSLDSRAYPELFAVLGYLYGEGSGGLSTTFQIPDYRGLFLRGADAGAGMDPGAAQRTAPTGTGTFNGVGSLQCDAFQDHTHSYTAAELATVSQTGQAASPLGSAQQTTSPNAPARFGPETRPKNVAVNYIIRYR